MQKYDPLELAQREMNDFDPLLRAHTEAMECRDCEEDIQKGNHSLLSLEHAEDEAFQLMESSQMPLEQYIHVQEVTYTLYKLWIAKCEFVMRWALKLQANGFEVAHVAELSASHDRAREWVRVQDGIREHSMTHEELTKYARKCNSVEQLQSLSQIPIHES